MLGLIRTLKMPNIVHLKTIVKAVSAVTVFLEKLILELLDFD